MARSNKFIADVNVEKGIIDFLAGNGYDIKWIPDYDCKIFDEELIELANREKRILITNDKDFGELIFLQKRLSTGVILFRVKGQVTRHKIDLMKKLVAEYSDKLGNHFVVASKAKIRFIPLGRIK